MIDHSFDQSERYASVPMSIILDDRLTVADLRTLAYLLSRTANWRVSAVQIATELKINERNIRRSLSRLEELGYASPMMAHGAKKSWRCDVLIRATPDVGARQTDAGARSEMTIYRTPVSGNRTLAPGSQPDVGARSEVQPDAGALLDRTLAPGETGRRRPTTNTDTHTETNTESLRDLETKVEAPDSRTFDDTEAGAAAYAEFVTRTFGSPVQPAAKVSGLIRLGVKQ